MHMKIQKDQSTGPISNGDVTRVDINILVPSSKTI